MNKEEARAEIIAKLKAKLNEIDDIRDQAVLKIIKDKEGEELKKIQAELKKYE
jgi:precorrin-6B methylase 1